MWGPVKKNVLGKGRKDRAGDQEGRGPCQTQGLCKNGIEMSPDLRAKMFISSQEKFVLFSAFQSEMVC